MSQITVHEQDWTPVVWSKRRHSSSRNCNCHLSSSLPAAESENHCERSECPKWRVHYEGIQALIRKRMELGMTQDRANQLCNFPAYTVKDIECHRILPSQRQIATIQHLFGITLRIVIHIQPVDT